MGKREPDGPRSLTILGIKENSRTLHICDEDFSRNATRRSARRGPTSKVFGLPVYGFIFMKPPLPSPSPKKLGLTLLPRKWDKGLLPDTAAQLWPTLTAFPWLAGLSYSAEPSICHAKERTIKLALAKVLVNPHLPNILIPLSIHPCAINTAGPTAPKKARNESFVPSKN